MILVMITVAVQVVLRAVLQVVPQVVIVDREALARIIVLPALRVVQVVPVALILVKTDRLRSRKRRRNQRGQERLGQKTTRTEKFGL
jgi:hypothetical protein